MRVRAVVEFDIPTEGWPPDDARRLVLSPGPLEDFLDAITGAAFVQITEPSTEDWDLLGDLADDVAITGAEISWSVLEPHGLICASCGAALWDAPGSVREHARQFHPETLEEDRP